METCGKCGGGRGIQTPAGRSLGDAQRAEALSEPGDGDEGPRQGPNGGWRLPAGLTEAELFAGYSRGPIHPVEIVTMGSLVAGAVACAMGLWPWVLP